VSLYVVTVRDPDSSTTATVFIDGEVVDAEHYDVDPGAGYPLSEWREEMEHVAASDMPQAVKDAVIGPMQSFESSEFIEDDRDEFRLAQIGNCLIDALWLDHAEYADKRAMLATAGGTVVVWTAAPDGRVVAVSDGDPIGPFAPDYRGAVKTLKFAVAAYPTEEHYLAGGEPTGDIPLVEADYSALEAAVSALFEAAA
jgi:hypothetical protein